MKALKLGSKKKGADSRSPPLVFRTRCGVARYLVGGHRRSHHPRRRQHHPFTAVNCKTSAGELSHYNQAPSTKHARSLARGSVRQASVRDNVFHAQAVRPPFQAVPGVDNERSWDWWRRCPRTIEGLDLEATRVVLPNSSNHHVRLLAILACRCTTLPLLPFVKTHAQRPTTAMQPTNAPVAIW